MVKDCRPVCRVSVRNKRLMFPEASSSTTTWLTARTSVKSDLKKCNREAVLLKTKESSMFKTMTRRGSNCPKQDMGCPPVPRPGGSGGSRRHIDFLTSAAPSTSMPSLPRPQLHVLLFLKNSSFVISFLVLFFS